MSLTNLQNSPKSNESTPIGMDYKPFDGGLFNDMENEIWKDVVGYEGLYQVSNLGNVKSLPRKLPLPITGFYYTKERVLTPTKNKRGYKIATLRANGVNMGYSVHRLVMFAFVDVVDKHTQVDHKDGDRSNNVLSNLRYCTNRENQSFDNVKRGFVKHSKFTGVSKHHTGKWRAYIKICGKQKWIGLYSTQEEASAAYQEELKKLL